MRQRQRWTKELKAEFWAAFVRHRDEGCNIREAWQRAYADFRAEGKLAPGLMVFRNWYRAAMRPQKGNEARLPDQPDGASSANQVDEVDTVDEVDGAGTDEAGEAAEVDGANLSDGSDQSDGSDSADGEAPGEAADAAEPETADDYTRKLEAMLRLYRCRTEADVDAVCDRLLPELAEEE